MPHEFDLTGPSRWMGRLGAGDPGHAGTRSQPPAVPLSPGEGDALVGFLDAHWDNKGIVPAEEFRRVNNQTVPRARMKNFAWKNDQTFEARIDVADYGPETLGALALNGSCPTRPGNVRSVGNWHPPISSRERLRAPGTFKFPSPAWIGRRNSNWKSW